MNQPMFNPGDRVIVTSSLEPHYVQIGDTATLTHQDSDGDWWADFDTRAWDENDKNFCLQRCQFELEPITERMKPPLFVGVFGDHIITLPGSVIPRWNQCIAAKNLLMWRSFAFLLSAEAKMAQVEGMPAMEDDLKFLFETAMQQVYALQPKYELEEA